MQDWFTLDQNTCNSQRDCVRECALGFVVLPHVFLATQEANWRMRPRRKRLVAASWVGLKGEEGSRSQGPEKRMESASIRQLEAAGELH